MRKLVSDKIGEIHKQIDILQELEKYESALKKLDTTKISRAGNEIVAKFMSGKFRSALAKELHDLGADNLKLIASTSNTKGVSKFQVSIDGTNTAKVDSVFSEGEQNIASLAGFLAEIRMLEHENGIIFDDPVTSLDHLYREKVAERLVIEAKKRQVIIFTHDLVFLFELLRFASNISVESSLQSIRKVGNMCGLVADSPWETLGVRKRINKLKCDIAKLKNLDVDSKKYEEKAAVIISHTRETWERLVEEVLLNGVVTRFEKPIHTTRLNGVAVDDEDYREINRSMKELSEFTGHDRPASFYRKNLTANDMLKKIEKLNSFCEKLNKRRGETEKRRRAVAKKFLENML